MTTAEFRSQPELVAALRDALDLPVMKLWLDALETENPSNFLVDNHVTPHFAHIMLGTRTGYGVYKSRFLLGGSPLEIRQDDRGEQTYSTPADVVEVPLD